MKTIKRKDKCEYCQDKDNKAEELRVVIDDDNNIVNFIISKKVCCSNYSRLLKIDRLLVERFINRPVTKYEKYLER